MSKQISHMLVISKKKLYSLIIMVAFLCIICAPHSSTFAASNLEEGIKELAQQISNNMIKTGKKKIAVVEFSDLDGMITAFGQHLAEELITELFLISPGQFEVVERRQLMKVLSEQRLTMSGLLDAKAMESVGKILGIEAIVTGSMTDLESNIKINARMIGIETARVFAVARTSIPKIGIVAKLMAKEANITQPNLQTAPKTTAQLFPSSVYTNKNSKIFHKYNCSKLNTEGLVEFQSTRKAVKAGGMACRSCNPSQQVLAGEKDSQEEKYYGKVQDSYLMIVVTNFSKCGHNFVYIHLQYENLTDQDLEVKFGYGYCAVLFDDLGNKSKIHNNSLPSMVVPAKGRRSVGFAFEYQQAKKLGKVFSLNIEHITNPPGSISFVDLMSD